MPPALETRGLVRRFGDFTAVDGVDLSVPAGSFYGFLGPNGAGKSTTIKCLTGLLRPTAGEIRILGLDPVKDGVEIRRRVGVLPEDLALFDRLSAAETLELVGRIHGIEPAEIRRRSAELLEMMDLAGAAGELVEGYSHGMKKKTSLAAALLPAPRLLFLDEPFEGVDPVSSRQIKDLLSAFVLGGGTVFLTSHVLEIVEKLCDRLGILVRGKLVAQGAIDELGRDEDGGLEGMFLRLAGATSGAVDGFEWLRG